MGKEKERTGVEREGWREERERRRWGREGER